MKLKELKSPDMLRGADLAALQELSGEIRGEILSSVSQNGGHLASNLGVVELTLALYSVFDFARDRLVWDVGHQCYAHKLITGRYESFATLRQTDGVCGFPRTEESAYDLFNTGHSSAALSQALGLARARDALGEKRHVVAVVGDGALTGGMCYEALNDIGSAKTPLIIVLNDNGMSISRNVGALSNYLTYMRMSKGWQRIKRSVARTLRRIPVGGEKLHQVFLRFKDHVRNVFVKDTFFASLGIRYLGPIDGHDMRAMQRVLRRAADMHEPVLLHVMTQKGKGYQPAEKRPGDFHGTPPFDLNTGAQPAMPQTFGEAAAQHLIALAQQDARIRVVTAAMTYGTGFEAFAARFPQRVYDVGIAEEHAVTMAAGMAKGGLRPIAAIYNTFMQRAYDQILEDVCAQNLPLVLLMDRTGLSGGDGASHHGMFGFSYLLQMPGLTVLCPRCKRELTAMMDFALGHDGPVAICYPRDEEAGQQAYRQDPFRAGVWEEMRKGRDAYILAVGGMTAPAMEAAVILEEKGISLGVVNASCLQPADESMLRALHAGDIPLFTAEENVLTGGFGESVAGLCIKRGWRAPAYLFALQDQFIPHGSRSALLAMQGLTGQRMAQVIEERIKR